MRLYSGMGTGDAKTLIERAQMAESSGMDGMWAEQLNGTPFVPLAAVAGATTKLELGTSIALAFTRSPLETALTALDMDVLTNGRFNLGLGTGVQRLVELWHGVPYGKAVLHLREVVESVRLIMDKASKNEPIRYEGEYVQVNIRGWTRPMKPVREKIPVYLAGVQAGMARLAGQVADGLLGHIIWSPFWIEDVIIPNVAKGLERSGRERKDIELMVPLVVIISRDEKEARMDAAREVAFFSTVRTYQPLMEAHGFGKITEEIQKRFREHGHSAAIWELVTDDMIDAFTVVGNVDRVSKKMKSFEPLVDAIMVEVPGFHLDTEKNEDYRKAIFETFSK